MSFQAVSWALSLDASKSSEKFILVCLANYADEFGVCYPSIGRLCKDTSMDRKTVIKSLKSLCSSGLLQDTGDRIGETKSVVIYRLVGIPETSTTHYVYRLTNPKTGEYYIGKRSFNGAPEIDIYRGSGKWTNAMAKEGISLIKEVLSVHQTSEEAIAEEARLFRTLPDEALCMNPQLRARMSHAAKKQYQISQPCGSSAKFPSKQYQNSATSSTKIGTQNLSLEPTKEPIDQFDEFWSLYPRKVAKKKARQKFNLIIKNREATAKQMIEAVKLYCEKVKGKDPEFILHPTTWLNGERWNDDYGPRKKTEWDVKLDHWKTGGWLEEWGPPPGQPGCKVPPEYLISQVKERTA